MTRLPLAALALAALLLAAPPAARAADYVVTASSAAGFSPGRMLKPDAPLSLAAGEAITVFGPGGPAEIAGPFSGALSAAVGAGGGDASVIDDLLSRRKRVRGLAASRGLGDAADAPVEAMLHILADRVWCVAGAAPTLYVRPAKSPRVIALVGPGGARHEMLLPADAATLDWPAAAPFAAGARYEVMVGDVAMPGGLALVAPGAGANDLERLLAAGCAGQADAVIAALSGG